MTNSRFLLFLFTFNFAKLNRLVSFFLVLVAIGTGLPSESYAQFRKPDQKRPTMDQPKFWYNLFFGNKLSSLYSEEVTTALDGPYKEYTLENLTSLIEEKNISRISDLIEKLPKSFTSFRVRSYDSRSLQCATSLSPRIIFFNLQGSLYCSFNSGNPYEYLKHEEETGKDCNITLNHLECLARDKNFRMHAHTFEFLPEEDFEAASIRYHSPFDEEITKIFGSGVKYFAKPKICANCHFGETDEFPFNSSRVIFDQYFLWPGFDRSVDDDHFHGGKKSKHEALKRRVFNLNKDKNPRYSAMPKRLDEIAQKIQKQQSYENSGDFYGAAGAPGDYLERLNLLFNQTQFANNIYRLLDILFHLKNIDRFTPILRTLSHFRFGDGQKEFSKTGTQPDHLCFPGEREDPDKISIDSFLSFFPKWKRKKVEIIFHRHLSDIKESVNDYRETVLSRSSEILKNGDKVGRLYASKKHTNLLSDERHRGRGYVFFLAALKTIFSLNGYHPDHLTGNFNGIFLFSGGSFYNTPRYIQNFFRNKFDSHGEAPFYMTPKISLDCTSLKRKSQFLLRNLSTPN